MLENANLEFTIVSTTSVWPRQTKKFKMDSEGLYQCQFPNHGAILKKYNTLSYYWGILTG